MSKTVSSKKSTVSTKTDSVPKKSESTKKSQPKVAAPVVVQEVPEPVPETPEATPETPETAPETVGVESRLKEAMAFIDNQVKELKAFKLTIKSLITDYQKEVRENKNKKKRTRSNKPQSPHGFTKPVHISEDLSTFLKVDKDTTIARPSVTREISKYVKEHELYDASNKSIFKADSVLKKLLGEPLYLVEPRKPEMGVGYGYKNLQKYLSRHFLKA